MATSGIAANAYASMARLTNPAGGATGAGDALSDVSGKSFGAMLKDALGAVVEAGHKSDAQSQAVVSGKANVVDVVTAVAETEVAVDALVAVRDKVIQAYEEIMRMPI